MLNLISDRLADFTSTERRVGEWVLKHPRQAAASTLAEVANATGVSEPSVIRFCRRLGLDGFREFSRRLTEALSQPASYLHSAVAADDTTADVVTKVLDASIQALVSTRAELPSAAIDAAVNALTGARQIVFAGLGASGHVATDACHKFFRLGIPCSALIDPPSLLQFAAIAAPGDVIVIVSTRGAWHESIDATKLARKAGAVIIAVSEPRSPLARAADIVLPCRPAEDTSLYTPMSSRLAQLAVLDTLQVTLALALGEQATDRLRATKQVISSRHRA
ncbi:MAG: MurR/RpiR family transcriptional regulator [Woeseiaceae bacterium]|nr:MurR/RpiR family transcriptional regulator [Woeseiaceae bacterium]